MEKDEKSKAHRIFNRFFHNLWKKKLPHLASYIFFFHFFHINSLHMLLISYSKELSSAILFLMTINGSKNGCMISAEYLRCVLKRNVGDTTNDINGDVTW